MTRNNKPGVGEFFLQTVYGLSPCFKMGIDHVSKDRDHIIFERKTPEQSLCIRGIDHKWVIGRACPRTINLNGRVADPEAVLCGR